MLHLAHCKRPHNRVCHLARPCSQASWNSKRSNRRGTWCLVGFDVARRLLSHLGLPCVAVRRCSRASPVFGNSSMGMKSCWPCRLRYRGSFEMFHKVSMTWLLFGKTFNIIQCCEWSEELLKSVDENSGTHAIPSVSGALLYAMLL